jgi:hypothetical protein
MSQGVSIFISLIVVFIFVALLGRKFNISSRYDRKPRVLNTWNSLDQGIDPTDIDAQEKEE